jgi:hypothetical protein
MQGGLVKVARRVGAGDGKARLWATNPLFHSLPDAQPVIAIDNGPQGIRTVGDIRAHPGFDAKDGGDGQG